MEGIIVVVILWLDTKDESTQNSGMNQKSISVCMVFRIWNCKGNEKTVWI